MLLSLIVKAIKIIDDFPGSAGIKVYEGDWTKTVPLLEPCKVVEIDIGAGNIFSTDDIYNACNFLNDNSSYYEDLYGGTYVSEAAAYCSNWFTF